jgi:hypothetical protein
MGAPGGKINRPRTVTVWMLRLCFSELFGAFFFFFFSVLGLELRPFALSHSTSPIFEMGFFEIGSYELFSRAGFEGLSPSLPAE